MAVAAGEDSVHQIAAALGRRLRRGAANERQHRAKHGERQTYLPRHAEVGSVRSPGIGGAIAPPDDDHQEWRQAVHDHPDIKGDVAESEFVPMEHADDSQERGKRGNSGQWYASAMPAHGEGEPSEEIRSDEIARAHDERRRARSHWPGE